MNSKPEEEPKAVRLRTLPKTWYRHCLAGQPLLATGLPSAAGLSPPLEPALSLKPPPLKVKVLGRNIMLAKSWHVLTLLPRKQVGFCPFHSPEGSMAVFLPVLYSRDFPQHKRSVPLLSTTILLHFPVSFFFFLDLCTCCSFQNMLLYLLCVNPPHL